MRQHLIRKFEAWARRHSALVVVQIDAQVTCVWFA